MKTVQQWLREVDLDYLVYEYLQIAPPSYIDIKEANISTGEAYQRVEQGIRNVIARFIDLPAVEDKDEVFFAYPSIAYGNKEVTVNRIHLSEIDDAGADQYGWMMDDWGSVAGYRIADTDYCRSNITEILAQILGEATFLGFSEERHRERGDELAREIEESMKAIDEGEFNTLEQVREHLGLPPKVCDPEEDEKRYAAYCAQHHYEVYCREMEVGKIRDSLKSPTEV